MMRRLIALCATAGALALAAPAFADTTYTDPASGQTYVATSQPASGPFDVITAPVRILTAPVGMLFQPASGAIGGGSANLVPYNPHCFVQTDFTGRHTA